MDQLIDVHSHFLTDRYVTAARRAGIAQPDGTPQWPTWSEDAHLRLMDQHDIAVSMLSISTPGVTFLDGGAAASLARHVNETGAELAGRRPDRFGHFATLPVDDVDAACAEAEHALSTLGSAGVTVETNHRGTYLGDPSLEPLWRLLHDRAATIFVHPTSPPNWQDVSLGLPRPMIEFLFDSARCVVDLALTGVLARHPDIRWILTHSAGVIPLVIDRVEALHRAFFPDAAPVDVRGSLRALWFDLAGTPFPHSAPTAEATFGADRMLYGSDYCFTPPPAVAAQIDAIDRAAPVDGRSWRALTSDNARALLAIDPAARSDP